MAWKIRRSHQPSAPHARRFTTSAEESHGAGSNDLHPRKEAIPQGGSTQQSPTINNLIRNARQTHNLRLRSAAYLQLQSHVRGHTVSLSAKWSDRLDDAEIHDALTDAMMNAIAEYDFARSSAFGSLFFNIFSNKLVDAYRHKHAKARGYERSCQLSTFKNSDDDFARNPDDIADKLDANETLARLTSGLTTDECRVVALYAIGHTYKEIAAIVSVERAEKIGSKTVDNELTNIKARLRVMASTEGNSL